MDKRLVKLGKAFTTPLEEQRRISASNPFFDQSKLVKTSNLEENKIGMPSRGDSFIAPYNKFEQAVQNVENVNQLFTNLGFSSNVLNLLAPASRVAKFLKPFNRIASPTKYIDYGLQGLDAARALVDPEYRKKADEGIDNMFDSHSGSNASLMLQAANYASQRPVGYSAALLRAAQNTRNEINQLNQQIKNTDLQIQSKKQLNLPTRVQSNQPSPQLGGSDFSSMPNIIQDQGLLEQANSWKDRLKKQK